MVLLPPQNTAGIATPAAPSNPPSAHDVLEAKQYLDSLYWTLANTSHTSPASPEDIAQAESYKIATILHQPPAVNEPPPWLANLNNNIDAKFTGLDTKITALHTKVTALDTKVAALDTKVAGLDTKVTALDAKVTALDTKVAALDINVNQLQHGFIGLNTTVNQMNACLAVVSTLAAEQPVILANSKAGNAEPLYDPRGPGWVLLSAPNPRTRDELLYFNEDQCADSAANLGLPPAPANMSVHEQQRRIAVRIGVTIH